MITPWLKMKKTNRLNDSCKFRTSTNLTIKQIKHLLDELENWVDRDKRLEKGMTTQFWLLK